MTEPPEDTVTPRALRAPELILRQPFGYKIDLWSFGCLIFELLTGLPLFCVLCLGSDQEDIDSADDALLCLMNDRIGPLPNAIKEAWTRYSKNYGPNGELLPVEGFEREPCEPLEESLAELKPDDINAEESKSSAI
jgi:non-specific serine/threonine protein kinase